MEKDIQHSSLVSEKRIRHWRLQVFKGLNDKFLWAMNAYAILSVVELIAFPSFDVAFGLIASFLGIAMTRRTLCYTNKLLYYPVTTLSLIFYCIFFEILPLPATLIEFKPLTYNMRNPYTTFLYLVYTQVILLIIHTVYVRITKNKNYIRDVLHRFNFFASLTSQEVWFLVIGSFLWYAYIMVTRGLYTEDNLNVNSRFGVFEWAINLFFSSYYQVLFIFYFRKFNNIKGSYRINHILIIFLSIIIFFIGIGTNMRTAAITVYANCAFCLVLYTIYYPQITRKLLQAKYVFFAFLIGLFFIGPFQQISEAMIEVRYERTGRNALELLQMTLSRESEQKDEGPQLIDHQVSSLQWDERYLDSDLFNRFCGLKILDESLFHANRLNAEQRQRMRICLTSKVIDQLPTIIKRRIGIAISYEERDYSLSDMLHFLSTDGRYYLGGIKIGSLPGLGLALFGFWFPLILIPMYFLVFYMMDSILYLKEDKLIFPIFFFASLLSYIALFSDRHFYLFELRFIFRGFWETVTMYLLSIMVLKRIPFLKH